MKEFIFTFIDDNGNALQITREPSVGPSIRILVREPNRERVDSYAAMELPHHEAGLLRDALTEALKETP